MSGGSTANDLARQLAEGKTAAVMAAAGCGKTRLIADSVRFCQRKQLLLTHTHAGVRALLNHLARLEVSPSLFRVATIHGFALKYASAFPTLAAWQRRTPVEEEWHEVPPAAQRTFTRSAVKQVLRTSYGGVFVDEYQDCSTDQHALITSLAEVLPCRILGDPLQNIFRQLDPGRSIHWSTVEDSFEFVGDLTTPHRWLPHNPQLGEWLSFVRQCLIKGDPIDLNNTPAKWGTMPDRRSQLALCKRALGEDTESIVGLRKWRNQCHSLSRYLKNSYNTLEDVECKELLEWAAKLESATGDARLTAIILFAKTWAARLPSWVERTDRDVTSGTARNFPSWPDHRKRFFTTLRAARSNNHLACLDNVLGCIEGFVPKPVFASREIWRDMRKSLRLSALHPDDSLAKVAWNVRDSARRHGRQVPRRCISTPLLVKGLEFDHTLVLDANDFEDPENLYVALTRGAKSLRILSANRVLKRPLPYFKLSPPELTEPAAASEAPTGI